MANRIQLRRDHSTNWTRINPVLSDGEPGLEIDTNKVKYGDGSTAWRDLDYASGGATTSTGGVTSIIAGNNITVNTSTGAVTVNASINTWELTSGSNIVSLDSGSGILTTPGFINLTWGQGGVDTMNFGTGPGGGSVNATAGKSIYVTTNGGSGEWVFGNDGVLTLSTSSTILGNNIDPNVYIETITSSTTSIWAFGTNGVLTLPAATPVIQGNGTGTDVTIVATTGTNTATWTFSASGEISLPGPIKNISAGTVTTTGSGDPVYPTALDLTKTVNKLADNVGSTYTLADGHEGQIMYLVPQNGATMTGVNVTINHARILNANTATTATVVTNVSLAPFNFASSPVPTIGVTTLIFTDGAWQADAGVWNY